MELMKSKSINPKELKQHPENEKIYGSITEEMDAVEELAEKMKAHGFKGHVIVNEKNEILSGHLRVFAARLAKIETISAETQSFESKEDELEFLIDMNVGRVKTSEQKAREYQARFEIEEKRAAERRMRKPVKSVQVNLPEQRKGQSRDFAAKKTGWKGSTAERASTVVKAIDNLKETGQNKEAEELRKTLNDGSVNKAYQEVRKNKLLPIAKKPETRPSQPSKPKFNRTNENVDWARWTWNPVTGCLHNCVYCYARDIANRFYKEKFEPTFRPERLSAPHNTKLPKEAAEDIREKNVFVCSMADLFGKWVPDEWIEAVMAEVRKAPQWNFLFLSKFPQRFESIVWPENSWIGASVDEQSRVEITEKAFRKVKGASIKWLSVEPLRERLEFSSLEMFDYIVIGAQSKSTGAPAMQPEWEWVESLIAQAHQSGCQIYWKDNLKVRPRTLPDQLVTIEV